MTDSHGPSKNFLNKILLECKKLSNEGKLLEASHLFAVYFPHDDFVNLDKVSV
tara:strand:+ start:290 stop:448 length:159 start_codon:yes stop_codon:yes gene_type:complete